MQVNWNVKLNFLHPNLHWRKWIELVNTGKLWLNNCLNMKLTISLKACAKMVKMASNYIMAKISKRFNLPTSVILPHEQEGKSAIVVEMPPLIKNWSFCNTCWESNQLCWVCCSGLLWSYETWIKLRQDRFGFWLILREKFQGREKIW